MSAVVRSPESRSAATPRRTRGTQLPLVPPHADPDAALQDLFRRWEISNAALTPAGDDSEAVERVMVSAREKRLDAFIAKPPARTMQGLAKAEALWCRVNLNTEGTAPASFVGERGALIWAPVDDIQRIADHAEGLPVSEIPAAL